MALLLPRSKCWECFAYQEWFLLQAIRDTSFPLYTSCPDVVVQPAALLSGIGYKSERFYACMNTYGFVETTLPIPPPLDVVWLTSEPIWFELVDQINEGGPPDWDDCAIMKFPGFQGGAWPRRWP